MNFESFTCGLLCVCGVVTVAEPICSVGDFDLQVRLLLSTEMLTKEEITNLSYVLHDLQTTLRSRWPGSEVIPLGSLVTGLSMKSSDVDCMVKVPYYNIYNETASTYLILQAVRLLKQQPHLYDNVRPKFRAKNKISLLKFNYIPTQINCDVNFISTKGSEISRMLAYYYSLDDRALTVAFLIKYWSKAHRTKKSGIFTSYTLNLMIIFYLQQENILPPFYLIERSLDRKQSVKNWKLNIPYNSMSVYQLLGGFFKYYNEFEFDKYVVSALLGRPIRRTDFISDILLDESRSKQPTKKPRSKSILMKAKLCVQDVFQQNSLAVDIVSS